LSKIAKLFAVDDSSIVSYVGVLCCVHTGAADAGVATASVAAAGRVSHVVRLTDCVLQFIIVKTCARWPSYCRLLRLGGAQNKSLSVPDAAACTDAINYVLISIPSSAAVK